MSLVSLDTQDKWQKTSTSPEPQTTGIQPHKPLTRGVEWVRHPPGELMDRESLNNLIVQTVIFLAQSGRRLAHAPRYLNDGICFDWILDHSAKNEDIRSLMAVQGLAPKTTLDLPRTKHSRSAREGPRADHPVVISLLSDDDEQTSEVGGSQHATVPLSNDPIAAVDSDEDLYLEMPSLSRSTSSARPHSASGTPLTPQDGSPAGNRNIEASKSRTNSTPQLKRMRSLSSFVSFRGLRQDIQADEILNSLNQKGIPSAAVTNIRIHRASDAAVASVEFSESAEHIVSGVLSTSARVQANAITDQVTRQPRAVHDLPPAPPPSRPNTVNGGFDSRPMGKTEKRSGSHKAPAFSVDDLYGSFRMLRSSDQEDDEEDSETDEDANVQVQHNRKPMAGSEDDLSPQLLTGRYDSRGKALLRSLAGNSRRRTVSRENTPRPLSDHSRNGGDYNDHDSGDDNNESRSERSYGSSDDDRADNDDEKSSSEGSDRSSDEGPEAHSKRRLISAGTEFHERRPSNSRGYNLETDRHTPRRQEASRITSQTRKSRNAANPVSSHVEGEDGYSVYVPKTQHARGRRLLVPPDTDVPFAAIYMRGDAQFISQRNRCRISRFSLPCADRRVTDACLLNQHTAVVGYDSGPYQISLIPLVHDDAEERPRRIDLEYRGHNMVQETPRTSSSRPNPGICSLAAMEEGRRLRFLSGGHDKTVLLWTVKPYGEEYVTKTEKLDVLHSQGVQCMVYQARNDTVLSCAGTNVHTTDLQHPKTMAPTRVSNPVLQIHLHPQNPQIVIHEVDDLDDQVRLYDIRQGSFSRRPCGQFGYRDTGNQLGRTYRRGSPWMSLFARGYADGSVHVWDYRNIKHEVVKLERERHAPVVHTVFADGGSQVLCYGHYTVTFWDMAS